MKKFLSVFLAVLMIFSTVSSAAPLAFMGGDTAADIPVVDLASPDAEAATEEDSKGELSAVDTTEYGKMVVKFTYDNLTAGTDYLADFKVTTKSLNNLNVVGGELGEGKKSGLANTTPFAWDGESTATNNHAAVVAREESDGNVYLELQGTGSTARFGIRDYNGSGFADAGHYILTVDVLSASNKKPFTKAHFQDGTGDDQFKHDEYITDEVVPGEWTTLVISHDDIHDYAEVVKGVYDHTTNTNANYIFLYDTLASGEVVGIDNLTLWWIPAEVTHKVTHTSYDGGLEIAEADFVLGGGIKTVDEIGQGFAADDRFLSAGYYLKKIIVDGVEYSGSDKIDLTTAKTFTAKWDKLNLLEYGIEFNDTEDFTFMKTNGALRTHASNANTWSDYTSDGYIRLNVIASASNIASTEEQNTAAGSTVYPYAFVHDSGYSVPWIVKNGAIPAGAFDTFEIRLRYTFPCTAAEMSSTKLSYWNVRYSATAASINPSSLRFPTRFYMNIGAAGLADKASTVVPVSSMAAVNGKWITVSFNAADLGLDTKTLDATRLDFDLPTGTTIDIDYIRFLGEPLPNVMVDMGGKTDDVALKYDATTTVADVLADIDYVGNEIVTGLASSEGGAALDGSTLISTLGSEDVNLYAVWSANPLVGDYGELIFEINFNDIATGTVDFGTGLKVLSQLGGKVGDRYAADSANLKMHNGSGTSYPALTTEIVERASGDNYLQATTNATGAYNLFQIYTSESSKYFSTDEGYLLVTYDVLWNTSNATLPHNIVYNRSQAAEVADQNERVYATQNGGWGYVVSTFDSVNELGKSGLGGNSATMLTTNVNYLKIHSEGAVVAGETYGIDNIRLWWVPTTVDVTVEKGSNNYTTAQTFSVNPAVDTVADLIAQVDTGNEEVSLAGLSLTEGGELLASDALLSYAYARTLYPKWSMPAQVTVDMGDNTTATALTMTYKGSNTIGDVVDKIVDHGDKKLVGLARTRGGDVVSESELIGTESADVTLYAVWEEYEYLDGYGYEFNDGVIPYSSNIQTNSADRTITVQDGYITVDLTAKSGYTGTWDTQFYLPLTTNTHYNPDKYIPSGVVTAVAARVRFRGTGTEAQSLTVSNGKTETFNPANPVGTYVHWAAPNNTWGTNLKSYTYDYNTYFSDGIVDGRWFTLYLDATSGNLNMYDNGVGYARFDFPYPMPSGTKIDVDYIRLVGENDLLPVYDGMGEYGEKVLEIDFDKYAAGTYDFPQSSSSDKSLYNLGATFNPKFNAANFTPKIILSASGMTSEIVADSNGGNYMKATATSDGTGSYLYFRNFSSSATAVEPFVKEDGYYIVTYDMKNETSASVPHTFRFNKANQIEHAADNFKIIENGEWDKVVLYFDDEINPDKVQNDTTLPSINGVDIVKWYNTSSVKSGETVCIDNFTLWYVPKTVGVVIDNSAIGEENTLIEEYPSNGMTNEELEAVLPVKEGAVFNGLSKTAGGELIYENRSPVSQILYSVWAIDTILTVDMGDNTKLENMTFQIPAGSSIKVSDIEAKFIDHGDKIFAGLSLTEGGTKLASTDTIAATESGALTIYALWEDYSVNGLFSVEFNNGKNGYVKSNLNPGQNSVYRADAKDASGNTVAGNPDDAMVWTETADGEGYITMNFVASEYAKAQATANGYDGKAAVYDSNFEVETLTGDATYIPAGSIDKIAIRMRYRGLPETADDYWRANTGAVVKYRPANSHAPFFFYTSDSVAAWGGAQVDNYLDMTQAPYRDSWFTVFIDASEFGMDTDNLYSLRFDPTDVMPDGSAVDIDFIRFISVEEGYEAPVSRQERTSMRIKESDADRNGLRVLAEIGNPLKDESEEMGWMFTSSAKWNASATDGSGSRSWYELKMDLYDPASTFIKVGYTIKDSELQVSGFFESDDIISAFTAVLYNVPVRNYKSPFIVRPFVKAYGAYAYGEPFEINYYEIAEKVYAACQSNPEEYANMIAFCEAVFNDYAAYLDANASYDSDATNAALAELMSSADSIKSNLVIPTNDTAPSVSGSIVTMKVWMDGALTTINVSTKNAYPALLTDDNMISEAYAEKPCVYYLSDGVYYIKSLGRSTDAGGNYVGIEKSDASAMVANVDASALFLSEIKDGEVASPFQRLPIDDELTNGQDSFFLGDFATGEFDFTFQRANSATRTIATGKTGIIGSDSKVVAKYNFPNGTTEWVSYSVDQLLKMGLDSSNANIADGIDFTNLTYVVSNNTTSTTGVNQREYENLELLVGEVDVPAIASSTSNFLAAKYNKVIVKTTSAASYVTVTFKRADGVSDSIKYYAYGTTTDGYRLFDVDLYGIAKYHSTISSLTVKANASNTSYLKATYLIEDPEYYSSADLASMNQSMIFQDMNYDNGFYVRDMDQKLKKDEYVNYKFASNGNTPLWMIDPWYAYDYSGTKANYELYPNASETATSLSDTAGSKVVKFNGTKTSTYADGSSHTGDVLSLTLNARKIYNGMTHTEMQEAGMTYWPHLLIEQNTQIASVDSTATSAGANKIFLEMDIKMTDYTLDKDGWFDDVGTKQLSFLLYSYLRPKASPNDRIWFGASLCSEGATQYPTWNRDTGASAYIYCIPQEIVYQGIANSFYQQIEDEITETSWNGSGTDSTSMDWVHISLDVTPYIDIAIDWANREDAFGLGALTRDDFYFDGVNIGFETHGNIDGTFEIANFNFVAYN